MGKTKLLVRYSRDVQKTEMKINGIKSLVSFYKLSVMVGRLQMLTRFT